MSPEASSPIDCSLCGAGVPTDAPGGVCPLCLLGLAQTPCAVRRPPGDFDEADPEPVPSAEAETESPAAWFRSRTLAGYEVLDEIARGGMGVVYRVRDRNLGRILAMKTLPPASEWRIAGDASRWRLLARFREEVQVTAQLDHPSIVPVHEAGTNAEGQPCFTMKLVQGLDLDAILPRVHAGEEGWNLPRAVGVCASEVGYLVGESPTGRIRRFATETRCPG